MATRVRCVGKAGDMVQGTEKIRRRRSLIHDSKLEVESDRQTESETVNEVHRARRHRQLVVRIDALRSSEG